MSENYSSGNKKKNYNNAIHVHVDEHNSCSAMPHVTRYTFLKYNQRFLLCLKWLILVNNKVLSSYDIDHVERTYHFISLALHESHITDSLEGTLIGLIRVVFCSQAPLQVLITSQWK